MSARRLRNFLLAGAALSLAASASAEDLRSALLAAYNTNPQLQAARAQQRALDETVPIERADALPGVSASATHTEFVDKTDLLGPSRVLQGSLSMSVPIYAGGGIRNSIKAAETRVEAGQADLRGAESAIFSQAVAAYVDVLLNQSIVGLNRKNVDVLGVNLRATRDRFEIGDLTRTDVAQSEARRALAQGDTQNAEANLIGARERYIQVIGNAPVNLQAPPPLPGLPDNVDDALRTALEYNPDLIAARERSRASDFDINVAGSSRLPRVEVFTGGSLTDYYGTLAGGSAAAAQRSGGMTAGLRASIPIFQGGRPAALRRQAQARSAATLETEIAAEREVIAQVRAAYSSWRAAGAIIVSTQLAVDAAALSLEGVRAENTVGNRTILDMLNAEQELLQARVRLVTAQRNAYVAGFSLLAAMGKAEARDLGLDGGTLYDSETNYNRVRGKFFDWDDDKAPTAQATRTVDTPAQDGSIPGQ